jgi:hypothetical protein
MRSAPASIRVYQRLRALRAERPPGYAFFEGSWVYHSFHTHLEVGLDDPWVEPWTPPGELIASSSLSRQIKATLSFAPDVLLDVCGIATAASAAGAGEPDRGRAALCSVRLTARGLGARYELRGLFVTPGEIVGTVLCAQGDLYGLPDGASGPFVLVRADP